jgi:hypothetical protein
MENLSYSDKPAPVLIALVFGNTSQEAVPHSVSTFPCFAALAYHLPLGCQHIQPRMCSGPGCLHLSLLVKMLKTSSHFNGQFASAASVHLMNHSKPSLSLLFQSKLFFLFSSSLPRAARSRSNWRLSSLWLVQACWKASFMRAVSIKRDSLSQFGSALARTKVAATHRISSGVKTRLGFRKNFTQTRCEEWLVHNLVNLQLS